MAKRLFISILAALMSILGLKAAQVALVTEINNYVGDAPTIHFYFSENKNDYLTKEINPNLSVELNNLQIHKHVFAFVTQSTFNVKMTGDCTVASILFADVRLIDENNPIFEVNGIGKLEHVSEVSPETNTVDILWTGPAQQNLSFMFRQDADTKHILITYDSTSVPEKEEFVPEFKNLKLNVDEIYPLNLPSDAPNINFSTTNSSVATVEKRGEDYVVNARGIGEALIEAKWDATDKWNAGKEEFSVTVARPTPSRQEFVPNFTPLNLTVGDTYLLNLPTDAPDMTFESSNPKVATVNNYSVNATEAGTTIISAVWEQTDKWNAGSASFNVDVSPLPTPKQDFEPNFEDINLKIGDTHTIKLPADAPNVTYSSSNVGVATIENGIVKANGAGETTIVATWIETDHWKAGSAFFKVIVAVPAPPKQDFNPNFKNIILTVGENQALNLPPEAPEIKYSSSETSVAIIENHIVKALAPGETTIAATWDETEKWKSGTATFVVTVTEPLPQKQDFMPEFTDLNLIAGNRHALSLPLDAPSIQYSTSNATVAFVEDNTVIAKTPGEATIAATWGETEKWKSGTASFVVTVTESLPLKQDFVPEFTDLNLIAGNRHALSLPQDAPSIQYSTSNATVAFVEDNTVIAKTPGEAVIAAVWAENDKWKSGTASFVVKVTEPLPQKQDFVPGFTDLNLIAGNRHALSLPQDAPSIQYSTSNATVAFVEDNTVIAKTPGEAVIAAVWAENDKWKSGTASFVVKVTEPLPQKQDFVPGFTDLNLIAGNRHALSLPQDAPSIQYSTSNATVAFVEDNTVIAKTPGEAVIAAVWAENDKWKSGTASFVVKVTEPLPQKQDFVPGFTDLNLIAGNRHALSLPQDAPSIQYNTSNAAVAFVEDNTVIANTPGEATIAATWDETPKWKSGTAVFRVVVNDASGPSDPMLRFQHSEVRGQMGWGAISQAATYLGDGRITYTSSDTNVAEVDATTGQIIKVNREGQAIITATLTASTNYKAATASYILKVESAPTDRDFKFDQISSGGFARTPFTIKRINKNYVQYTIDGLQRYDYSINVCDDILEVTVRNEGIFTLRASAADGSGYALMQLVIFPCIEITPTGGLVDAAHSDIVLFEATGGYVRIGFNNSSMYKVYIDDIPFSATEIPVVSDMSVYYTLKYASMPFNIGAWLHLVIKPYAPVYIYDTITGHYIINSDEGHILYRILDGSGTEDWVDTGSTELRLGKEYFSGRNSIDIQLKTRKPTSRPGYEAESGISTYTLPATGSSGIEDILDDTSTIPQLYDLNGRLITTESPSPGIYILKRGGKTSKIIIK